MSVDYLHFDTNDASIITTPFNCSFQLANPLKKVNKIYLKSAEIPVGWFNIRTDQTFQMLLGNTKLWMAEIAHLDTDVIDMLCEKKVNDYLGINQILSDRYAQTATLNGAYPHITIPIFEPPTSPTIPVPNVASGNQVLFITFTIPANTYSINTLIYSINQGICNFVLNNKTISIGSFVPYLSIPASEFNYNVTLNFDTNYHAVIGTSYLMTTLLGFEPYQSQYGTPSLGVTDFYIPQIQAEGSIVAKYLYQLYQDTYISIYFSNIPHNNTNFNNKLCSFKVPINSGLQTILYNGDNSGFTQYITISDPNFIFANLSVIIFDRFGYELVSNNGTLYHWSFTLGFQYFDEE